MRTAMAIFEKQDVAMQRGYIDPGRWLTLACVFRLSFGKLGEPLRHKGDIMFSHVGIGSNDIERSKRFYDAVLGTLGAGEALRNQAPSGHTRLFYRHAGNTFCVAEPINGEAATCANGGTIGFKCESAEKVKEFHDTAVAHGGQSIEEPPGLRQGTMGAMHLAYVRDPDGNKLCALYRAK